MSISLEIQVSYSGLRVVYVRSRFLPRIPLVDFEPGPFLFLNVVILIKQKSRQLDNRLWRTVNSCVFFK